MAKLMNLRRAGVCADCSVPLAAGIEAYWIASERVVRCIACQGWRSSPNWTGPVRPSGPGAGGSAQAEYERRAAREIAEQRAAIELDAAWRTVVKEDRPVLGRLQAAITPKPTIKPESQSTRAWKVGAEGERRVAEVLTGVAGIEVLHDRHAPGRRANIDHLVVGPAGVFVVDAKKYKGRLEVRDRGTFWNPDHRLYVAGRERSHLLDGVLGQAALVRSVLGPAYTHVPVHAALCFIGAEWDRLRAKQLQGVSVLWPKALPSHVAQPGPLAAWVGHVAKHLRQELPAAR